MAEDDTKQSNQRQKLYISLAFVAILVGVAAALYVLTANNTVEEPTTTHPASQYNYSEALVSIASTDAAELSDENFLDEFERYYDESIKQVRESNPSEWNKNMIDRAYLCLLYADRTQMYTSVEEIATRIEGARAAKVDVDGNSAGISEERFMQIKEHATQKVDEQLKARWEENEEI